MTNSLLDLSPDAQNEITDVVFSAGGLTVYDCELVIDSATYEQCINYYNTSARMLQRIPLWQGDLILGMIDLLTQAGEVKTVHEAYQRIASDLNYDSTEEVEQRAYVARNVPPENRHFLDLSYSVYRVVAPLPVDQQVAWLQKAHEGAWGAKTLREAMGRGGKNDEPLRFAIPAEVVDAEREKYNTQIASLSLELEEAKEKLDRLEREGVFSGDEPANRNDKTIAVLNEIVTTMAIEHFSPEFIVRLYNEGLLYEETYAKLTEELSLVSWD